jgi:hypothetical protein
MVVMGPTAALVMVMTPAPGMGRRRGGAEGDRAQDKQRNNDFLHGTLPQVCGRSSRRFLYGSRPRSLINAELAERSQNFLEPIVIAKFTGVWAGLL